MAFRYTGFADEAGKTLDEQIAVLKEVGWDGIELRAFGYKKRGYHKVFLSFFSVDGNSVSILRNNQVVESTSEDVFLDEIDKRGQASYTYKVCEITNPEICSPSATIVF